MAKIPYYVRYIPTTTVDPTDGLILDVDGSDTPKRIPFSDFVNEVAATPAATNYVEKTANYTLTSNDFTVNCTSNSFTITLPTAVGIAGRCFEVTNTGAGIITLATTGGQTIQGDASQSIYQDECFLVRSTGANWIVI